MIDDALTTVDQNERETKLQKLCAVLNERCSIVPLWQPVGLRAFHHDLQGVEVNGRGTIYFQDVSWA